MGARRRRAGIDEHVRAENVRLQSENERLQREYDALAERHATQSRRARQSEDARLALQVGTSCARSTPLPCFPPLPTRLLLTALSVIIISFLPFQPHPLFWTARSLLPRLVCPCGLNGQCPNIDAAPNVGHSFTAVGWLVRTTAVGAHSSAHQIQNPGVTRLPVTCLYMPSFSAGA